MTHVSRSSHHCRVRATPRVLHQCCLNYEENVWECSVIVCVASLGLCSHPGGRRSRQMRPVCMSPAHSAVSRSAALTTKLVGDSAARFSRRSRPSQTGSWCICYNYKGSCVHSSKCDVRFLES